MSNTAVLSETSAAPAPRTKGVKRKAKASSSTSALPSKKRASKPPLGKLLASNDVETRETAVENLLDFLSGRDVAEAAGEDGSAEGTAGEAEPEWDAVKLPKTYREDNMKVLWQGCYYCMYMCDKPAPQAKLAEQLAQPLLLILENPKLRSKTARLQAALSYLSVFWITIVREWPSIDKHRTDKYYSLMRRMVHSTFKLLRATGWNERAMQEVGNILTRQGGPLHLQDTRTPISIAYHVIDLFVEELERSLEAPADVDDADAVRGADAEEGSAEMPVPLGDLLQPIIDVLAQTSNKAAYQRVLDHIFDPVLGDVQASEADPQSKKRTAATTTDLSELSLQRTLAGQKEGLDRDILKRIFAAAARETTDDIARRRLYAYVGKRGYEGDE